MVVFIVNLKIPGILECSENVSAAGLVLSFFFLKNTIVCARELFLSFHTHTHTYLYTYHYVFASDHCE